jgi:hypothetical protein
MGLYQKIGKRNRNMMSPNSRKVLNALEKAADAIQNKINKA